MTSHPQFREFDFKHACSYNSCIEPSGDSIGKRSKDSLHILLNVAIFHNWKKLLRHPLVFMTLFYRFMRMKDNLIKNRGTFSKVCIIPWSNHFMKSNDLDILLSIRIISPTPQGYVITEKENDNQTGRQEMSWI